MNGCQVAPLDRRSSQSSNDLESDSQVYGSDLDEITPQVPDTWRADELYVKIKGNMKYVFAMMDDETRFWIAHEVADTKDTHDARHLL